MKKFWLLILVCFFLWPLTATAFTVSPTRTLLTIDPGGQAKVFLNLRNDAVGVKKYRLETISFSQNEKGEVIYELQASQAENWVKTSVSDLTLNAGEERRIDYGIVIPKGALPGSYYLALAVKELPTEEGEVGLSGQIVSLLTLQVAGEVMEKVEVRELVSLQSVYFSKPWVVELNLRNLSSVEVPVQGKVFLKDPLGEFVAMEKLSLGRDILANSERRLQANLWEHEKLLMPGIYRLYFDITYGKTGAQIEQEIAVWYLPDWLLAIATGLLILIILLLVLKSISRKRNV